MGLLSSIGNAIKNVASTVVTAVIPTEAKIKNVGAVLNAAFNPFSKDKVVANVSNPVLKTALETVANHPYVSAAVVSAPIVAIKNPTAATTAVSSIIPKSVTGKVALAAAVPVATGALINQPAKTVSAAVAAPSALSNFGGNLANLVAEPSISNLKTLVTENPLISAGLATAAGVAAVKTATSVANIVTTERNTKAIEDSMANPNQITVVDKTASSVPVMNSGVVYPITPQTKSIGAAVPRTGKKRRTIKSPQNISQKVNVIVSNKSSSTGISSKKYIKESVLA